MAEGYDRELDLIHKRLDALDERMAAGFQQVSDKLVSLSESRSFITGYAKGAVTVVGLIAGGVGAVFGLVAHYLINALWPK